MGQFLPYAVTVFEGGVQHDLGDFRRVGPACAAARLALTRTSNTLAVVKDRDGRLVYAVDRRGEWLGPDFPRDISAQTDSFDSSGTGHSTDRKPSANRRLGMTFLWLAVVCLVAVCTPSRPEVACGQYSTTSSVNRELQAPYLVVPCPISAVAL